MKLRGPKTEVIDAQGSAVLPGFNDIHTHLLEGGLQLANVGLEKARTLAEIQNPDQRLRQGPSRASLDSRHGLGI